MLIACAGNVGQWNPFPALPDPTTPVCPFGDLQWVLLCQSAPDLCSCMCCCLQGLGKTAQTITFLGVLRTMVGNRSPHLVVCPASLIQVCALSSNGRCWGWEWGHRDGHRLDRGWQGEDDLIMTWARNSTIWVV